MLSEVQQVEQVTGEPRRRWFNSLRLDLIVWLNLMDHVVGFQLCYGKPKDEHALTWKKGEGFVHHRVDDGERNPAMAKRTPILVADGLFPGDEVAASFKEESRDIDPEISSFVYEKLLSYPQG